MWKADTVRPGDKLQTQQSHQSHSLSTNMPRDLFVIIFNLESHICVTKTFMCSLCSFCRSVSLSGVQLKSFLVSVTLSSGQVSYIDTLLLQKKKVSEVQQVYSLPLPPLERETHFLCPRSNTS